MATEEMTKERASKIVSELDSRTSDELKEVLSALVASSNLPPEPKEEKKA